jgi:capsular polysaccharide export protein
MNCSQGEISWIYRKLLRHPLIPALLRELNPGPETLRLGWGLRPSGRAALRASARSGQPLLLLEDSFVRSLQPGKSRTVYGLIADSQGIHYDSTGKSDLFTTLHSKIPTGWIRNESLEKQSTLELMERFRQIGASKYNWFPGEFQSAPLAEKPGILVVDQTRGDMAIRAGGMAGGDFDRMLKAAFDECEGAPVYLRGHPDHVFKSKKTCFSQKLMGDSRLKLLSPDLSPAQCFSFCRTVMVGSSLMGMEALIHGCKVVTFGRPFFAGKGLTDDRASGNKPPQNTLSLEDLFETAYLR